MLRLNIYQNYKDKTTRKKVKQYGTICIIHKNIPIGQIVYTWYRVNPTKTLINY